MKQPSMQTLYLIRHATPDWSRKDIPYELPPGPPLTDLGQAEAEALGHYLAGRQPGPWYSSPLERCLRTAEIASRQVGSPTIQVSDGLAEIRPGEPETEVRQRLSGALDTALASANGGNVPLLFTHGGPVALLLETLGMNPQKVNSQRIYDRGNPLPPAGVWQAQRESPAAPWQLELVFRPQVQAS
jgi:2,3-bisphosphoglycerate-dependent phosphoglycerate mutase